MGMPDPYDRIDRAAAASARPGVLAPPAAPAARPGIAPAPAKPLAAPAHAATVTAPLPTTPGIVAPAAPLPSAAPRSAQVADPFLDANKKLVDKQASAAIAANSPINDYPRIDANNAQRLDLFKQYHNGMNPGEHAAMLRASAAPVDPFRAAMTQQMTNPGASYQGGIPVYQGNAGDGGMGPSIAERNAGIRSNAIHQMGTYDLQAAQAASMDPMNKIPALDALAHNPAAAKVGVALNGGDPGVIDQIQQPGDSGSRFNPVNYLDVAGHDPVTRGAAEILAKPGPMHEKAGMFAAAAANDPTGKIKALWAAHMAAQQARGQDFDTEQAEYNPGNPSGVTVNGTALDRAIFGDANRYNIFSMLKRSLGFGQGTIDRNQKYHRDQAALGYAPVPTANIGLKP